MQGLQQKRNNSDMNKLSQEEHMIDNIQELSSKDFDRAITWEQGRRNPGGPAKALLRLIAKYPRLLLHDLEKVS